MLMILCAFIIISVFEFKHLLKTNEKKEAVIYAVITATAIALAAFLILAPDFKSFSRLILNIIGVNQ
jgi:hypothetical protein